MSRNIESKAMIFLTVLAFNLSPVERTAMSCQEELQPPSAQSTGEQDSQQQAELERIQTARGELAGRLVNELDELIPGNYEDRPDQLHRLQTLASEFIDGKGQKVNELIDEMANADANMPPRDLLLAALSFGTNNPNQGRLLLERAAVQHRNHPGIPLAFSRLALLQGRYFDAYVLAEKARLVSQNATLPEEAKQYYQIEAVDSLTVIEMRRGELQAANGWSQQWEQLAPKSDKMLLASAEIQFLLDNSDQAIQLLNSRGAEKLADLPTELIMSNWYQTKRDMSSHSKWIQLAYEKNPKHAMTQLQYMSWLVRQEKFAETKNLAAEHEKQFGESLPLLLIKGRVAFAEKDFPQAESNFSQVFQASPNTFEHAYLYILTILENQDEEQRKTAVPLAQRVYQQFPNNQLAVATFGWALLRTGDSENGKQVLDQASRMGDWLPDTAYFLAVMKAGEGNRNQIKVILEPFVDTPEVFLYRSQARELFNADPDSPLPGANSR